MTITIRPTLPDGIPALRIILDATELFPSEMSPDMIAGYLADAEPDAVWLSSLDDAAVTGFCYSVPEQIAEGAWNMLAIAVAPALHGAGTRSALSMPWKRNYGYAARVS